MTEKRSSQRLEGFVPWPEERASLYRREGLWLGQSIGASFEEVAASHSHRTAFVDCGTAASYGELSSQVRGWASSFRGVGLCYGDRVVLHLPNGLDLLAQFLALLSLGVVPVLALPGHRYQELSAFARRAAAVALILTGEAAADYIQCEREHCVQALPSLRQILVPQGVLPDDHRAVRVERVGAPLRAGADTLSTPTGSDVALLQLSGGSTGIPKLIPRTHDDYLYSIRASMRLCQLTTDTRYLLVLPMMHNFALSSPGVLGVILAGGVVVNCPSAPPAQVFRHLREEGITLTALVPSLLGQWVTHAPKYLGSERLKDLTLQVGGAKLDTNLSQAALEALGCRLQQVYGMAEGLVNYTRFDDPIETVLTTQGRPLSAYDEVRVRAPEDPEGESLSLGMVGELQTRGPYTIAGYYDDERHNREAFTSDGFYRTRDLVRIGEGGNLEVMGRLGERILRAGEKIDPGSLEASLLKCKGVAQAAVLGLPDPMLGQCIAAYVVPEVGEVAPTLPRIRADLRRLGLSEFKLPDRLFTLEALPLTPVGKLDKPALRAMRRSPES